MQVCTSLQTDNHASTPPLSFLQAGCPSCRPTNSVKALKATRVSRTEMCMPCSHEGKFDLIILKSGRTQPIRRRRRRYYPTISWKRCITPE